jgi:uncharacterized repeat protein (TIGR03837 family)
MNKTWDLFCRVIDNYGDIGVSWRLAKLLHHDHQQTVRLWLDQPHALAAMEPDYDPAREQQLCHGITIQHWLDDFSEIEPAEVVIETFGCELPTAYRQAMRNQAVQPIWLNLEYLSAEPWVSDFHLRPSKQACGLDKTFFFPGMLPGTGGLMREGDYAQRQQTITNSTTQNTALPNGLTLAKNTFKISVFCYENKALKELVNILSEPNIPLPSGYDSVTLLIPAGRAHGGLASAIQARLATDGSWQQDRLRLYSLPFMSQAEYDQLLWQADLNLVRGEESFVRAQWAAKPFVWHIYPTDDGAHWDKLHAFNDAFTGGIKSQLEQTIRDWQVAWNQQQLNHQAWLDLVSHWSAWQQHAIDWVQQLEKIGELTTNLVKFVQTKV